MINVLLVVHEYENQHKILPQVVHELHALGDKFGRRYRARLVHDYQPNLKHKLWALGRSTVVISLLPLRRFLPPWATLWTNALIDKVAEYQALEKGGIPIPKWVAVYEGDHPDLSAFDEVVVVKPARGGWGALVRVMRRDRVTWRPLKIERMNEVSKAMIAQEYIHTGPWPISYRVGTVFGEPIYAWRHTGNKSTPPFEGTPKTSKDFTGRSIVASAKGCTYDLDIPEDVIDFARRVHTAFPTIPLLGTDILREEATGKLYVSEVNATGDTFHLTSDAGLRIQREFGLDVTNQFGGAKAVARGIYRRLNQFVSNGRVDELNRFQSDIERMSKKENVLI